MKAMLCKLAGRQGSLHINLQADVRHEVGVWFSGAWRHQRGSTTHCCPRKNQASVSGAGGCCASHVTYSRCITVPICCAQALQATLLLSVCRSTLPAAVRTRPPHRWPGSTAQEGRACICHPQTADLCKQAACMASLLSVASAAGTCSAARTCMCARKVACITCGPSAARICFWDPPDEAASMHQAAAAKDLCKHPQE